jgi:ankyrin repeat protein
MGTQQMRDKVNNSMATSGGVRSWRAALTASLMVAASLVPASFLVGCKSSGPIATEIDAAGSLTPDEAHLLRSASRGRGRQVAELLDAGVNMNVRDATGRSALYFAAACSHKELTNDLLSRGADKDAAATATGWTPLHAASAGGHEETLQVLLGAGVPIDVRDAEGNTPLHLAAARGHEECSRMLIERGADRAARNADDRTPADLAAPGDTRRLLSSPGGG